MTTSSAQTPQWFEEYLKSFLAAEAHGFILYGDITGYAYESMSHRTFLLSTLASRRLVVVCYDRAKGITFADPAMREKALALLGTNRKTKALAQVDPFEQALAGISTPTQQDSYDPFSVRKPLDALTVLEKLLRAPEGKQQVALVIDYADAICPPTDKSLMQPDSLTILVMLQSWARDTSLGSRNNPFFLLARTLTDLHADLRSSASGYKAIEIALPTYQTRLAYLTWYLAERRERGKPITLVDLDQEELSRLTAGLNLRHIEDILLLGAKTGGVTRLLVKARKDAIITTENSEVAEMLEPLPGGFSALGGMEKLIAWSKAEVITSIRSGNSQDAPKGVLLVGPPGSGKTYFVRALAWEIGFNAVSLNLENILGSFVGESERKLKQFFQFARAPAPVLIFLDEIDQSDVSRRGTNSGNPVASNLFSAMLRFMGDETLRGKVIFFFASNRPDLIDPALMRFGRIDAVIPVLLPNDKARYGIVQAQAKAQKVAIEDGAIQSIVSKSNQYSAADIAAVVSKARKLSLRNGKTTITIDNVREAMRLIKPATPQLADWYTLLAVRACNDVELLPEEEASLMDDPRVLQAKIKEAAPEGVTIREERSW